MSRKSLIMTSVVLGLLCGVMALIPTLIESLDRLTGTSALPPSRRGANDALGTAEAPPTLWEWISARTSDDPTQLKIVGTPDPSMSVEERVRLLEEAEKNQPEVPAQPAPGERPRPRRTAPRQPPQVLPPDEPDPTPEPEPG